MRIDPKLPTAALATRITATAPDSRGANRASGPAPSASLATILEQARRATGQPLTRAEHDLVVRGHSHQPGSAPDSAASFVWRFGAGDRSLRGSTGLIDRTSGCDGEIPWIEDAPGRARSLELGDAERAKLLGRVLSGDWLDPRRADAIELAPDSAASDPSRRALTLRLGAHRSTLQIDASSAEPRSFDLAPSYGNQSWAFEGFRAFGSIIYPAVMEQHLPAGMVTRYEVESVTIEPASAVTMFAMPAAGRGTRFDRDAPSELVVERSTNGFLLVKPIIDGREVGWFIYDTGAGANVITREAADSLGLKTVGKSWLGLAAGATSGGLRRADSLRLGPLTVEQPLWVEMDLTAVSSVSGRPLAGIIGYEVLMRATVEIEVATPRIALHPRGSDVGGVTHWQPLVIYGNHPYVGARFEGRDGLFRLDTGAPQVPVIFNGPAVERLGLLESRETQQAKIGIPGGMIDVALGKVAALEIGGHRFDELPAIFPLQSGGAFDDRYTTGNLGQEVLHPFRAIFDYAGHRAAFVERPASSAGRPVER